MHEYIEKKKAKKKMMGIKGVVLLLSVLIMTLLYLVASKEAVFVFLSVETQRVFARYFFLNTTRRRSTGRQTFLPSW